MFPRLVASVDGLCCTWSHSLETLDKIDDHDHVLRFQTGPETAIVYCTYELCDFWIRRLAGTEYDISDFDCPYDVPASFMPVALPHMPHGQLTLRDQASCWCRMMEQANAGTRFVDFWVRCIRRKNLFETRFLFGHLLATARALYAAMDTYLSDKEILGSHMDDYELQLDMIRIQAENKLGLTIFFHSLRSDDVLDMNAMEIMEAMATISSIISIPEKIVSILWIVPDRQLVLDRLGQLTQALDRSSRRVRRTIVTVLPEPGLLRIDLHDSSMLLLSPATLSVQLHDVAVEIDSMCCAVLPNARLVAACHPWSLVCGLFHRNVWTSSLFTRAPRDMYKIISSIQ